jgi:hypothetical protein
MSHRTVLTILVCTSRLLFAARHDAKAHLSAARHVGRRMLFAGRHVEKAHLSSSTVRF